MTQDVAQRWLNERRHLLVELVALSRGLRNRGGTIESLNLHMQQFCVRLIDYVSAGHFEVYADLARAPDGARLFARLGKQITRTTDKVVAFNEYANRRPTDRGRMGSALAELSLALEDRFCMEDQLLAAARARVDTWRATTQPGSLRGMGIGSAAHRLAPAPAPTTRPRTDTGAQSTQAVSVRRGQRAAIGAGV